MDSSKAINQANIARVTAKRANWLRLLRDYVQQSMNRVKKRPLFQKVIIANTALITVGTTMGIYLEKKYFASRQIDFLILFMASGVSLSTLLNYMLVKLAFSPLDEVSESMKAIRAGHRGIRVPEINNDPQIEELSRSLNSMLNSIERQRKQGAASAIKAQEEERKRIARELHDETSQSLTGLVLGIRLIREMVPDSMPEVKDRLHNVKDLAHNTLNEVHTMAVRLRPSVLDDLGLCAALRSYIKEFSENTEIDVEFQKLGMFERLPSDLETVLYRVVQEALTNVARHSGADRCQVRLERRNDMVSGIIADNGCGFDPQSVMMSENGRGLGLHGMKERIELVGGFLEFTPGGNQGTTIHLEVPVGVKEGVR